MRLADEVGINPPWDTRMYKAYLAGLSGEHIQFMNLSEGEAAAFTLGSIDKDNDCRRPKSRRQLEEAVAQLVDGEWTTTLTAMQARLNQMQAERDELRDRCDEMAVELAAALGAS